MIWYSASIILAVIVDGPSDGVDFYENIHLIEAENEAVAMESAKSIGRLSEVGGSMLVEGKSARLKYYGVRKLVSISNPVANIGNEITPIDGSEVSYSLFRADKLDDIKSMVRGDAVSVVILE